MKVMVILLLALMAAVVVFSVQNASPVAVTFLAWHFNASLAIVVFLSFFLGMAIGAGILSWTRFRRSARAKRTPEQEQTPPASPPDRTRT